MHKARLVKRYKRFLADVVLDDGQQVTAHVANPGAMTGLAEPGSEVWLSLSPNKGRKLPWSWELVRIGDGLVGVNTLQANAIVGAALAAGSIPELAGYSEIRREVPYGDGSRVDFLLRAEGRPDCYLEVKSVTLKQGDAACFPDSKTARGARHLDELARRAAAGDRAVTLYLAQRADCARFRVAEWIDPAYGRAWHRAKAEGVETLCYACNVELDRLDIAEKLPVELNEVLEGV
jgi:sugar fermentation stimulation protein A